MKRFQVALVIVALAAIVTVSPAGARRAPGPATMGAPSQTARATADRPTLADINRVVDLERLFDADAGKVRVVLLVSPT